MPYSGSYKFTPKLMQGADNVAIILPKSMKFEPGAGTSYTTVPDDVNGQTYLAREVKAGQPLDFTVTGEGALPRDTQGGPSGATGPSGPGGASGPGAEQGPAINGPGGTPGGGIGNPIDTPDPLSKYKWWILGALGLILAGAAAFLLRKPAPQQVVLPVADAASYTPGGTQSEAFVATGAKTKSALLLEALKEELFAIESEKIAGTLSAEEYAEVKAALETVLRRALKRQ